MYKREKWTALYEEGGLLNCEEFWVRHSDHSMWSSLEKSIPERAALVAIFPGPIPEGMRWSPTDRRARSEQQRIDIWEHPDP